MKAEKMAKLANDLNKFSAKKWVLINPPAIAQWDPVPESYNNPMNLGLLHVAQVLLFLDCEVEILDLQNDNNLNDLNQKLKSLNARADYFGISNNYFRTFESSKYIADYIVSNYQKNVLIGGMHAGYLEENPWKDDEYIDRWEGEFKRVLSFKDRISLPLPYHLWPNLHDTDLILDVSQGCSAKCTFCLKPQLYYRSQEVIETDLDYLCQNVGIDNQIVYTTYNFGEIKQKDEIILDILKPKGITFQTQSRPDQTYNNGFDFLKKAREAGLEELYLGLETINPEVLIRYKKTKNPDEYVNAAKNVIEWCSELDIHVKLNLIIFDGEGPEHLDNLRTFLDVMKVHLSGFILGPLLCFPGTALYEEKPAPIPMKPSQEEYFRKRNCYPVKLNELWDFDESLKQCEDLMSEYKFEDRRLIRSFNLEP